MNSSTFDAHHLKDLSPGLFADLMTLSGLEEEEESCNGLKNGLQQDSPALLNLSISCSECSSRNLSGMPNETVRSTDNAALQDDNSLSVGETQSGGSISKALTSEITSITDTEVTTSEKKNRTMVGPVQIMSQTKDEADIPRSFLQPCRKAQESVVSVKSCESELERVAESVIKVCALKTLIVLMKSNKFFETLATNESGITRFLDRESSEENQEMLNVSQTLMRRIVGCAVRPSPVKRVVSLRELERAQTVLLQKAIMAQSAEDKNGGNSGGTSFVSLYAINNYLYSLLSRQPFIFSLGNN